MGPAPGQHNMAAASQESAHHSASLDQARALAEQEHQKEHRVEHRGEWAVQDAQHRPAAPGSASQLVERSCLNCNRDRRMHTVLGLAKEHPFV